MAKQFEVTWINRDTANRLASKEQLRQARMEGDVLMPGGAALLYRNGKGYGLFSYHYAGKDVDDLLADL